MIDSIDRLQRKLEGAGEIRMVVRTMKAIAAANIHQFEMAVHSLGDYYRAVELGFAAYFRQVKYDIPGQVQSDDKIIRAVVIGSDIGMVGQFNDRLADFVNKMLYTLEGRKDIWTVGERIQLSLNDAGLDTSKLFILPNSVNAVTPLIGEILMENEQDRKDDVPIEFYIFYNRPGLLDIYEQVSQRLLPLDEKWRQSLVNIEWPTRNIPQVAGKIKPTLTTLVSEYLFVSLFRACVESLAAENSSRLQAMQHAEKNIDELLVELRHQFNRLRQDSIDEELFDLISGFEALQHRV